MAKPAAIFCYGVDEASKITELAAKWDGVPTFVFDHGIDDPKFGPGIKFIPEGISPTGTGPCFPLKVHLDRFGFIGKDIILKLDIEGTETDVLRATDLSRVAELVVRMTNTPRDVTERLEKTHKLVHSFGEGAESWLDRARRQFFVRDCTWVRKDLVVEEPEVEEPLTTVSFVTTNPEHVKLLERIVAPEDQITDDVAKADREYVMVLDPDDLIPLDIILSLDGVFRKPENITQIVSPVFYNGLPAHQARVYKREDPKGGLAVMTDRPIYNLSA